MSVEFYCTQHVWSKNDWIESITETFEIHNIELLTDPELDEGEMFYFIKGSIRGILLSPEEEHASLRLSLFASETDWQLTKIIFSEWLKDGVKITWETQERVSKKVLSNWKSYYLDQAKFDLKVIQSIEGGLSFGTCNTSIHIDSANFPNLDDDNAVTTYFNELSATCLKYAVAYPAMTAILNNEERFSAWALVDTLINKDVDWINVFDIKANKSHKITPSKLRDVLGEKFEETEDSFFLPELTPENDQ